jgi:2-polyprenyl-3-methyl-5-hydroxy-6-metoxy-1,4-benzoquinol methylase
VADPEICPACGAGLRAWRTVPSADPTLGAARVKLRRCERCGTAVTGGGLPAGLYDTGAYAPGSPRLHALARPLLRTFDLQRLALIGRLAPPPARLLDAGAGRGRFVASARAAGYQASGVEPSLRGVQAAAEMGIELQHAGIEAAEVIPGSYDVVSLWHVLEHLSDPAAALERVGGWLRPGGVLLVGVPNLDSLQARLGGERWFHLDAPRHRVHFTPRGLEALLDSQGLAIVHSHHLLAEHNPFGMWQSLVSRLTSQPSYLYNLLKRNAPLWSGDLAISVAALPLVPLAALLELAAGAARRGGTIAVLARRAS